MGHEMLHAFFDLIVKWTHRNCCMFDCTSRMNREIHQEINSHFTLLLKKFREFFDHQSLISSIQPFQS